MTVLNMPENVQLDLKEYQELIDKLENVMARLSPEFNKIHDAIHTVAGGKGLRDYNKDERQFLDLYDSIFYNY